MPFNPSVEAEPTVGEARRWASPHVERLDLSGMDWKQYEEEIFAHFRDMVIVGRSTHDSQTLPARLQSSSSSVDLIPLRH